MAHPMIFAEDYLDFDRDEAQAEWNSGFPPPDDCFEAFPFAGPCLHKMAGDTVRLHCYAGIITGQLNEYEFGKFFVDCEQSGFRYSFWPFNVTNLTQTDVWVREIG